MTRNLRLAAALGTALLLILLATTMVLAQDELLGGKLRTGDTVTVAAGETVDGDLYLLAGTVAMDGTVDGDVLALGGTITVNGTVTGDVLAAGGTVTVAGTVEGDVRTTGGQVTLSGAVAEDAVVTGGQASVSSGSTVGGDLIVSGGQVTMAGTVTGNVEGSAGTYSTTGSVGGTEHVVVSPREGEGDEDEGDQATAIILDALRHFVVLVIFGALILWLLPRALPAAERVLRSRPAASLGSGLLACLGYFVFLIAALLLMVLLAIVFGLLQIGSLVGIELIAGLLSLFTVSFLFVLAVAYLADLVVGLTLARVVAPAGSGSRWRELALLVAGAAVVVIVTSLPVIGGLVKLLVVLFGLGALALAAWHAWRPPRPGPPAPAALVEPTPLPPAPASPAT
jgi:cytoskeletal protein CcmA (bactofilin family)